MEGDTKNRVKSDTSQKRNTGTLLRTVAIPLSSPPRPESAARGFAANGPAGSRSGDTGTQPPHTAAPDSGRQIGQPSKPGSNDTGASIPSGSSMGASATGSGMTHSICITTIITLELAGFSEFAAIGIGATIDITFATRQKTKYIDTNWNTVAST